MNKNFALMVLFGALLLALGFLAAKTASNSADAERQSRVLANVSDSLAFTRRTVDSLRAQTPGLGEYMSSIQLHVAKLWFAGQASNWALARYELDELAENMEGAEALHAKRDSVDISSVLASVRQTQLPLLKTSINGRNARGFADAYGQTLAACNGCHRPAGYPFIHIITPTREPVTNQEWKSSETH